MHRGTLNDLCGIRGFNHNIWGKNQQSVLLYVSVGPDQSVLLCSWSNGSISSSMLLVVNQFCYIVVDRSVLLVELLYQTHQ